MRTEANLPSFLLAYLHEAVYIILREIIREFSNAHDSLVESVTIVSDSTLSIVGNSQLALKRRDAIAEG